MKMSDPSRLRIPPSINEINSKKKCYTCWLHDNFKDLNSDNISTRRALDDFDIDIKEMKIIDNMSGYNIEQTFDYIRNIYFLLYYYINDERGKYAIQYYFRTRVTCQETFDTLIREIAIARQIDFFEDSNDNILVYDMCDFIYGVLIKIPKSQYI